MFEIKTSRIISIVVSFSIVILMCSSFEMMGRESYSNTVVASSYVNNTADPTLAPISESSFNAYMSNKSWQILTKAQSTKSVIGFNRFQVTKNETVLLFDVPKNAAVLMDIHNEKEPWISTAYFYTQKGVQIINLKPGYYTFHVTTSEYPNDLSSPWTFWILEPVK